MAGPGEKKGAGKGKQLPAERTATRAQGGGGQRGRQQGVPAQEAEARVVPPVEAGGRRRGRDGVPATEPVARTGSIPPATAPTSVPARVSLSHHERLGLLARRCGLIPLLSPC
jgi:hypothetical protein